MERFVGVLIEHYAGAFPVWLAPVQVAVIPITDDQIAVRAGGRDAADGGRPARRGRRSQASACTRRSATPSSRRSHTCWWSGKREAEAGNVAVRLRSGEDLGAIPVDEFITLAKSVVDSKSLELTS